MSPCPCPAHKPFFYVFSPFPVEKGSDRAVWWSLGVQLGSAHHTLKLAKIFLPTKEILQQFGISARVLIGSYIYIIVCIFSCYSPTITGTKSREFPNNGIDSIEQYICFCSYNFKVLPIITYSSSESLWQRNLVTS